MAEIRMPKMGDGMEEGTINVWLKKVGDQVTEGDPIAEVETDKANVEIAAYETGTLTKIIVQVGETVPVGDVIAIIGVASAPAKGGNGVKPIVEAKASPVVEAKAPIVVEPTPEPSHAPLTGPQGERVKSSPLARKVAEALGIDIAQVSGSGPNGRIIERDVTEFQKQLATAPAAPSVGAPPAAKPPTAAPALAGQDTKPTKMREAIAKRTVLSKNTIPHFYVTMIVEMDRAQKLLKDLNADPTLGKVTVNDLIVKACAIGLGKVPEVNSTWTPDNIIRRYAEAHIGIAVGIDDGLIIPVVRDCHTKTLRQISAEAKALIGKARNGQLTPADYSGGTFSVSNLGMMGADEFIAIVNPPEAAILAIGGIVRTPVVKPDSDDLVIRSLMKITLSADHRLLDGVVAAKFLQEVKKTLEAPFSLLS
jgi:pyruvate dehydrogenase E2 component (dihydrolipoamide acetyltransferase)